MIGPIHNKQDFEREVAKMQAGGWTDADYMARQLVDDHFRHTGVSLHHVQGAVQFLIAGLPAEFVVVALRKVCADTGADPDFRTGAEALLRLLEAS
jgi:hypothetical protein